MSSHTLAQEKAGLLSGSISSYRTWQINEGLSPIHGLELHPNFWCDIYFLPPNFLLSQLPVFDLLGSEYDGYLLFLNEPDLSSYGMHGQCEVTPRRGAELYVYTKAMLPLAKIVGPGISHVDYYNDFMWLTKWFNHVVSLTGGPPQMYAWDIHTYVQDGDPLAPVNALEQFLVSRGVTEPKFFISEWGSCNVGRLIEMKVAFDNDDRVLSHSIYEQSHAYWDGESRCILLFDESSSPLELTELGEAFVNN